MKLMKAYKLKEHAVGLLVVCLGFGIGCSPVNSPRNADFDKIEVYYRGFSTLAPISYSATDLEKRATVRLNLTDREHIARLAALIDLPCKIVGEGSAQNMDIYLLVKQFRGSEIVIWQASPFHFYSSSERHVCELDLAARNKLERFVESLAHTTMAKGH